MITLTKLRNMKPDKDGFLVLTKEDFKEYVDVICNFDPSAKAKVLKEGKGVKYNDIPIKRNEIKD